MGVGEILVCLVCLSQFSYSVEAYDLMNNLLRVQKKRKGCPSYEGYGLFSKYSFPPGKGEKPCSSQCLWKPGLPFLQNCWQLYQPTQFCFGFSCATLKRSDEAGDPAVTDVLSQCLWTSSVSQTGRFDVMVTGWPSSMIPYTLRDRGVLYRKPLLFCYDGLGEALHCHREGWLM